MTNIKEKVYNFKTKYQEGFIKSEIDILLKDFPNINMVKFNDALIGNTCMVKDNDIISYHCDIEKALICGIENRYLKQYEWD